MAKRSHHISPRQFINKKRRRQHQQLQYQTPHQSIIPQPIHPLQLSQVSPTAVPVAASSRRLKENRSLASPFTSRPCSPIKQLTQSQSTTSSPTRVSPLVRRPSAPTTQRPTHQWVWPSSTATPEAIDFNRPPSQLCYYSGDTPPQIHVPSDLDPDQSIGSNFFKDVRAISTPIRFRDSFRSAVDSDSSSSASSSSSDDDEFDDAGNPHPRTVTWQSDSLISPPTICAYIHPHSPASSIHGVEHPPSGELGAILSTLELQPLSSPAEIIPATDIVPNRTKGRDRRGTIRASDFPQSASLTSTTTTKRTRSGTLVAASAPKRTRSGTVVGPTPVVQANKSSTTLDDDADELTLSEPWVDIEEGWTCAEPPSPEVTRPSGFAGSLNAFGKGPKWGLGSLRRRSHNARRRSETIALKGSSSIEEEAPGDDDELLLRPGENVWEG